MVPPFRRLPTLTSEGPGPHAPPRGFSFSTTWTTVVIGLRDASRIARVHVDRVLQVFRVLRVELLVLCSSRLTCWCFFADVAQRRGPDGWQPGSGSRRSALRARLLPLRRTPSHPGPLSR